MCDTCKIVCVCVWVCVCVCRVRMHVACASPAPSWLCVHRSWRRWRRCCRPGKASWCSSARTTTTCWRPTAFCAGQATLTTAVFYFSVCVMTIIFVFYQLGCSSSFFKYYSLFFKYYTEMTLCSGRDVKLQILSPCIVKLLTDLQI